MVIVVGHAKADGILFEVEAPFEPTIRVSLTASQVLRRPAGITYLSCKDYKTA